MVPNQVIDVLKEWVSAGGLVTRQDFARLEDRIEELEELLDALEERLESRDDS